MKLVPIQGDYDHQMNRRNGFHLSVAFGVINGLLRSQDRSFPPDLED